MAYELNVEKEAWFNLLLEWNKHKDATPADLEVALEAAYRAQTSALQASVHGSVGSVSISNIDLSMIYQFVEHTKSLWDFTNSILYEAVELIDIPFTNKANKTLDAVYELNPNEITIKKPGWFFGLPTDVSLQDIFAPVIDESGISNDFKAWADRLDTDEPSQDVKDVLYEARFWEGEFQKAAAIRGVADSIFTAEIREDWPNMSPQERDFLCHQYVQAISFIMSGGQQELVLFIEWKPYEVDSQGNEIGRTYAPTTGAGICISDGFVNYYDGVKSNIGRCIDALTHESYHKYQYQARQYPALYNCPQSVADAWNETYINAKDRNIQDAPIKYQWQPIEYDTRSFASLCS